MRHALLGAGLLAGVFATFHDTPIAAAAPDTVVCKSFKGEYRECASRFTAPILVRQVSRAACIINNSWGFNPDNGHIWVTRRCRGIFADQHGYHHGASGGMDVDARRYSNRGTFIGYGPLVNVQRTEVNRITQIQNVTHVQNVINMPNYVVQEDVDRISRQPEEVDHSQDVDMTPHFDRQGNPNFDTDGNYIGPHGVGALVDPPEDQVPDEIRSAEVEPEGDGDVNQVEDEAPAEDAAQ